MSDRSPPAQSDSSGARPSAGAGVVIAGVGGGFLLLYVVFLATNDAYSAGPEWLVAVGIGLVGTLGFGLVYGGHRVATAEFTAREGWRVALWLFAGLLAALALTFWPIFYQRAVGVTTEDPGLILLVSSALGANAGVVAGVSTVESDHQSDRLRHAHASLEFLNRLLRHNVLNAVAVIRGNATHMMMETTTSEVTDRAETVQRHSEEIVSVIDTTRVLVRHAHEEVDRRPVDLTEVVSGVVEATRETYECATVEQDLSPATDVRADPLVARLVENLVTNAIVHCDHAAPHVTVTLTTTDGTGVLRVADDGPGLPDEAVESLIDPGSHGDHGLGLYLVDTLVEQYGGRLEFGENDPRGTVVTVELPLA